MSEAITTAFVQQFSSNVYMLSQQMMSKLRGTIRNDSQRAKKAFFDRLRPAQRPQVKISRHQNTPLSENVNDRRAVDMLDFVHADLVDRSDQIRLLINPESLYARNFAMAFGREYDFRIIDAFTATVETGQFGGGTSVFPAGNTLASSAAGLTISRVRQVKRIFDSKDVREDGRYFVVSAQAMEDLLESTEVISSDYNTVKALVQGTIEGDMWMGFKWIRVSDDILPIDGSLDRSCFAYQRDGMAFNVGQDLMTEMDRRPDKMNSLQIMCTATFNALRVDDDCVLEVLVREAA